ncbi:MAG: hypothetical protein ACW99U_17130 [Candidatus Thorarchaeota archaeon]|jgi:hypothetical protein
MANRDIDKDHVQELIDWIYSRLDEVDSNSITWRTEFIRLVYPFQPAIVAHHWKLIFEVHRGGNVLSVSANLDRLLEHPRAVTWLLVAIGAQFKVRIKFGFYKEPKLPPEPFEVVGDPWPEQGPNVYRVIHWTVATGDVYSDERGVFVCERRQHWWTRFNVWVLHRNLS